MKCKEKGSSFDVKGVRRAPVPQGKASFGCWLRYFFKDLQPLKTVAAGQARDSVTGDEYHGDLYMAGFFAYFLSFFVLPDFPSECIPPYLLR